MLSDGKMRTVHYSIIEDGGFAGFGQGVEWCVVGLDRNWALVRAAGLPGPDPRPIEQASGRSAVRNHQILFLKCSGSLLGSR